MFIKFSQRVSIIGLFCQIERTSFYYNINNLYCFKSVDLRSNKKRMFILTHVQTRAIKIYKNPQEFYVHYLE